ncbi:MAG: efflux RND transporter periplasmic adaptor subunit [Pseudomonadota bacterium]
MNPKTTYSKVFGTISLLMIALVAGCSAPSEESAEAPLRPVRTIEIGEAEAVRERVFSGLSQSSQESRLSFKVAGTIVELPISIGTRLQRGQLVSRLDSSVFELAVEQAQANLLQAEANLRNASTNYSRVRGLYENSNASRGDLDSARAQEESAEAQANASRSAVEIAELERSYTRLTASADCNVVSVDAEVNENVNAGTMIAAVDCGDDIEVSLGIPESLIGSFESGLSATINFDAIGKSYEGSVTEVGAGAGSVGATFPVTVQILNPDDDLRPGLAAEVSFAFTSASEDAVQLVPLQALIDDHRGTYVFLAVPNDDGKTAVVTQRNVTLGEITNGGVEVLSGLNRGDHVITAGVAVIRDQQRVLFP